jgi:hypothetical protein
MERQDIDSEGAPAADAATPDDIEPGATDEPLAAREPSATGEPRVDAALRPLMGLEDRPVAEHPPVFERVHGQLVDVLGELRADHDPSARDLAGDAD